MKRIWKNILLNALLLLIVAVVFFVFGYTVRNVQANRASRQTTKTMQELENKQSRADKQLILASMKNLARSSHFSGAVLTRRNSKTVTVLEQGYSNYEEGKKVDGDTIFPICSISKVLCSVIIGQLSQEKKLSYDDNLAKFYPEIENSDHVTIRQLLTHTSGYQNPEDEPDHFLASSKELLDFMTEITSVTDSNEFNYANANFVFLALISEKIERKKYSEIIRSRIFNKLEMDHTFSPNEIKASRLPTSYSYNNFREYQDDPSNYSLNLLSSLIGAGELCSTVEDLEKFFVALENGELLTKEDYQELFFINGDSEVNYAGGLSLKEGNKGYISASGSFNGEGIKSYYEGDKNGKNMTIILSNMHGVEVPTLADQFFSLIVAN